MESESIDGPKVTDKNESSDASKPGVAIVTDECKEKAVEQKLLKKIESNLHSIFQYFNELNGGRPDCGGDATKERTEQNTEKSQQPAMIDESNLESAETPQS